MDPVIEPGQTWRRFRDAREVTITQYDSIGEVVWWRRPPHAETCVKEDYFRRTYRLVG